MLSNSFAFKKDTAKKVNSSPKVSVIVPVYNTQEYIYECVNSLICQTLEDIEIILVNDGSTDSSPDILDNFAKKDKRIKVIHQKNKKQGGARNSGIKIAKGEYITFVDSDDWVDRYFLEKLYEKAIQSKSDIVMCDYYRAKSFLEFKKIKKSRIDNVFLQNENVNLKTSSLQPSRKSGFCLAVCWNKLFKKEIAKKYLKFPEGIFFEDSPPVFLALAMANHISVVNEKLYFYRISNTSSTTHAKDERRFDLIKVQNILLENFNKYDFGKFKKFCVNFMIKDLIQHFNAIDKSFAKKFYKEMKKTLCKIKKQNCFNLIDLKYKVKGNFILNTNYYLSLIIAKL